MLCSWHPATGGKSYYIIIYALLLPLLVALPFSKNGLSVVGLQYLSSVLCPFPIYIFVRSANFPIHLCFALFLVLTYFARSFSSEKRIPHHSSSHPGREHQMHPVKINCYFPHIASSWQGVFPPKTGPVNRFMGKPPKDVTGLTTVPLAHADAPGTSTWELASLRESTALFPPMKQIDYPSTTAHSIPDFG